GLLDVGDGLCGQTAVGDVDLAVLHRLLQGALVTAVELQGDARVLGRDGALVVRVDREDGLVLAVGVQLVRAGAGRLAVLAQAVRVVGAVVDDGSGTGGDLAGEGGVRGVEPEDDGPVVGRLDLLEGG